MSSSVGMMTFPIWWESHNPAMFQTTNQISIIITWKIWKSMGRIINYGQIKKKFQTTNQIMFYITTYSYLYLTLHDHLYQPVCAVDQNSLKWLIGPNKSQQRPTQRSPWRRREQKLAFPKSQVHALAKQISQCMDCDIWWYSPIFIPIYIYM